MSTLTTTPTVGGTLTDLLNRQVHVVRGRTWHWDQSCIKQRPTSQPTFAEMCDSTWQPCRRCAIIPITEALLELEDRSTRHVIVAYSPTDEDPSWMSEPWRLQAAEDLLHLVADQSPTRISTTQQVATITCGPKLAAILAAHFRTHLAPLPLHEEDPELFLCLVDSGMDDTEAWELVPHLRNGGGGRS